VTLLAIGVGPLSTVVAHCEGARAIRVGGHTRFLKVPMKIEMDDNAQQLIVALAILVFMLIIILK
jgi:hypothetical protein